MKLKGIADALVGPGLFRLILATAVFVYHVSRLGIGRSAVYIFFTLSGYWICLKWTKLYTKHRDAYRIFIISRFWRIAPVFILSSAVTWSLLLMTDRRIPDDINWIHQAISNVVILGYGFLPFQANDPAWSLDVELQFYLVSPALFFLLRKGLGPIVGCCIVSIGSYLIGAQQTALPYLIFFAAGASAATFRWRPTRELALFALACSIGSVAVCLASPYRGLLLGGVHPGPLYVYNDMFEIVFAIAMIPWALYTTGQKGCSLDRMCGDLSFIVYLLHWPVIGVMTVGDGSYAQRAVKIGEAAAIVYLSSWAIWRWFDRPIDEARSRWVSRAFSRQAALHSSAVD